MADTTLSDIEKAIEIEAKKANPNLSVIKELLEFSKSILPANADKPPTQQELVSSVMKQETGLKQFLAGMGTVLPRVGQGLRGIIDVPGVFQKARNISPEGLRGSAPAFNTDPVKAKDEIEELKTIEQATPITRAGSMAGDVLGGFALPFRSLSLIPVVKNIPGLRSRAGQAAEMGLTSGAINAAITPENRVSSGAYGALGAGIPGLFGVGQRILPEKLGGVRAPQIVGEQLRNDNSEKLITALRGGYNGVPNVQSTAAVITKNPNMQALESGSRVNTPELWTQFDAANAKARYEALLKSAGTPEQMAKLLKQRDEVTTQARSRAITSAKSLEPSDPLGIAAMIPAVEKELNVLATGEFRPNQMVQKIVKYVRGQIEDPAGITPEQLYEMRKVITSKIVPGDELSAAASGARAQTMGLVKSIDNSLDSLSNGSWSKYLTQYGIESKSINSRRALQNVIEQISRGMGKENFPPSLKGYGGEFPFGRAVESNTFKDFGGIKVDRLLPEDRALVEALKTDLLRSSQAMNIRATGGPGTATEIAAGRKANDAGRLLANQAIPIIAGLVGGAPAAIAGQVSTNVVNRALMESGTKGQQILARLLQNPEYMAQVLEKAKRSQIQMDYSKRVGGAAGTGAAGTMGEFR